MANRIVVDPITRIEGHFKRAEVEITDGTIRDAFLSSTMVRGLENIVKGRNQKMFGLLYKELVDYVLLPTLLLLLGAVENALGINVPRLMQKWLEISC